jgi:hypothetical protein
MSFINILYSKIKEKIENFFNKYGFSEEFKNELESFVQNEDNYKYSSGSVTHPFYLQIKDNASLYLLKNGYSIYKEDRGKIIYKSNNGIFIFITNQGYDFPDVFIGKDETRDKAIWFSRLEKIITGKEEMFEKYKLLDNFYDFEYEKEFLQKYYNSIIKIEKFY